jgi:photosystem II stability/assembly factor-like uncharacterized protein
MANRFLVFEGEVMRIAAAAAAVLAAAVVAACGMSSTTSTQHPNRAQPAIAATSVRVVRSPSPSLDERVATSHLTTTATGTDWETSVAFQSSMSPTVISCPTSTVCFAGGATNSAAQILRTTNAGRTWVRTAPLPLSTGIGGIACPSTTRCYAVASDGIVQTSNAGQSWSTQPAPAGSQALDAVACPTTNQCLIAGDISPTPSTLTNSAIVLSTVDSGSTWVSHYPQATGNFPASSLTAISCPTALRCFTSTGTGGLFTTSDGGTTWSAVDTPEYIWGSELSCPSARLCYAGGQGGLFRWSRGSWTTVSVRHRLIPGGATTNNSIQGVACPSVRVCFATLNGLAAVSNDGVPSGEVVATTNAGRTWNDVAYTPESGYPVGIACPSASSCFATVPNSFVPGNATGFVLATRTGGRTWHGQAIPAGIGAIRAIACPSTSTCVATVVGGVLVTTDSGATWTSHPIPPGTPPIWSIACPSITSCFALTITDQGNSIIATTDTGLRWTTESLPHNAGPARSISCPSITVCFSGDLITVNAGKTWQVLPPTPEFDRIGAASCPSITTCFALTDEGMIGMTTDSGGLWTSQPTPAGTKPLVSIACATTTACVSIGSGNCSVEGGLPCSSDYAPLGAATTTNGGSTWTADPVPSAINLTSVSCATVTNCSAVGYDGLPLDGTQYTGAGAALSSVDGGTSWQVQSIPPLAGGLLGVSCPSPTTCYAVGSGTGTVGGIILKFG